MYVCMYVCTVYICQSVSHMCQHVSYICRQVRTFCSVWYVNKFAHLSEVHIHTCVCVCERERVVCVCVCMHVCMYVCTACTLTAKCALRPAHLFSRPSSAPPRSARRPGCGGSSRGAAHSCHPRTGSAIGGPALFPPLRAVSASSTNNLAHFIGEINKRYFVEPLATGPQVPVSRPGSRCPASVRDLLI